MKTVLPLATVWPDIHMIINQIKHTILISQYLIFTRKEIPPDLDFHPLSVYKQHKSLETPEQSCHSQENNQTP